MGCNGSKNVEDPIDMVAKNSVPGVTFSEEFLEIAGAKRNVATWLPETHATTPVKAVVFISHGLNEHALCYYNIARDLTAQNYAVLAMDHMCHGKSEGRRGVISDYRRLYQDFIDFVNTKRDNFPDVPVFIFAHSMGTLVALMAVMNLQNIAGIVLSGTALFAGPASASPFGIGCLYPLTRTCVAPCLLSITSRLDPAGPTAPIVVSEICANAEYLKELPGDTRRNPAIVTNKTARELFQLIEEIKGNISKLTIPFMCIHGGDDKVTLKNGAEFVFRHAGTDITQRRLLIISRLRHEVIHEADPAGSGARNEIVQFFETRLLASFSAATASEPTSTSGVVAIIEEATSSSASATASAI